MSLRYIFGGSGTGKTEYCLSGMVNAQERGGDIMLIVPEQFSLAAEEAITKKSGKCAVMRIQVLSFLRLAYNVFSQTGSKSVKTMDSTAKSMVVRKVISQCKKDLKYYRNVSITTGFVEKVCGLISELCQYAVSADDVLAWCDFGIKGSLGLKIHDISLIYRRYTEYVSENYITSDEILDLLAESIDQEFFSDTTVWIDNFSGFTPQEYKVLEKLIRFAEVNVCLTLDDNRTYYNYLDETDIFYEPRKTVNKLTEIALEQGAVIGESVYFDTNYRLANSPELAFLEKNFFNYASLPFKGENNKVKVFRGISRFHEAEYAAAKIISLVRCGYQFSDIGVLCGDVKAYGHILENTFSRYNIPLFVDSRMDIFSHPLTELVRSAAEIIARNWSYESVFRFLKTGLTPMRIEDVDLLENYALAYGIRGSRWRGQWKYGFFPGSPYEKEKICRLQGEVCAYIDLFGKGLTASTVLKAEDFAKRVYNMLTGLEIRERLGILYIDALEQGDGVLMRRHLGAWNIMAGLFDKMTEVFGGQEMRFTTLYEMLEAGISSSDMGIIPPFKDKVILGDAYRSRLDEIKVLFVLGVAENEFPRVKDKTGLLNDKEREGLEDIGISLAPFGEKAMSADNFHIYSTLAKARELLILSYPATGTDGKGLYPSNIISRIEKLFKNGTEEYFPEEITVAEPMFESAAKALGRFARKGEIDQISLGLIKWYENQEGYKERLGVIWGMMNEGSEEHVEGIYGSEIKASASMLERYVECPFGFFARYNLQLGERQVFTVEGLDMGNLFHDVLEEFAKSLARDNVAWDDIENLQLEVYTEAAFEKASENFKSDVFVKDSRSAHILNRAKKIAKKSIWALAGQLKKGEFKPLGAEIDFGRTNPATAIPVEIDESHKLLVSGRIDRADIYVDGENSYVKIIDYKTGSVSFDFTELYYGMQLQLILYMNSIIKNSQVYVNMEGAEPGGVFYFRIKDPVLEYQEDIENTIEEKTLKEYRMSGLTLKEESVIQAIDKESEGSSPVIPVSKNKAGKYTSRSGGLVSQEDFRMLLEYSEKKAKEIGTRMIEGEIGPFPYKNGGKTGCDYCPYAGICGFEPGEGEYNVLSKKTIADFREDL